MKRTSIVFSALLGGWLILLMVFPLVQADAETCVQPPAGLVSWWPGDGNADDIQDSNHGTLQNGAIFAAGEVGQAFNFDGLDDSVLVADNANLRVSSFTLDAWINTADAAGPGQGIIAKAQASGNWLSYMLRIQDGGRLAVIVENRAENRYAHWRTLSTLLSNTWYHVAGTWQNINGDTTDAKIYIDGVEQAIEMSANQGYDSTFTPGYTTEPLLIGTQEAGGPFKGLADEVEIFNRVLSAAEIAAIFNAGSAGKCKVTTVAIDIKPSSFPNSINPRSEGVIPVAILTTNTFDAITVDPTTVLFGATGNEAAPVRSALEDVDLDGDTDMILHFNTQDTGIVCGDTSASLAGETFGGQAIKASDSINTVGCK
jgi:concanavalin A-like lectin/glucanase superfamily protein